MADNHDAALDAVQRREEVLYRQIEKGERQISELRAKLAEQRNIERIPEIERHRSALETAAKNLEEVIRAGIAAQAAHVAAFEAARRELGADAAQRFLPAPIHFVGFFNNECLRSWQCHTENQKQRSARQQRELGGVPPKSPLMRIVRGAEHGKVI